MRTCLRLFLQVMLLLFIATGCYYDKEDVLYPSKPPCDTSAVTYTQSIKPIMTGNCNVCHSTALANGGVITDTYEGVKATVDGGILWPAVNQTGPLPMPQGGSKLSDCDLAKIRIWIADGAKKN